MSNGLDPDQDQHYADHDSGGSSEGPPDPPPRPRFEISYENEIIWSQRDQISEIKSVKRTPTPLCI